MSKIVDGLFTSKIRYGLQLYGKVRLNNQDPTNGDLKEMQITQNRMMRLLQGGKKLSDQIPTVDLLKVSNMLFMNQLNAQIKSWRSGRLQTLKATPWN